MKALFLENGNLQEVEKEIPQPMAGEALIRVKKFGICNTDLELERGYMDFSGIPGHEFVGEVIQSENVRWRGQRVVGEINIGCNDCDWCARGMQRHCPKRMVLGILNKDGVMAEYITLPESNLHEVPGNLSDEQAVFTEPLAAAFEIAQQCHIDPDSEILILGDGKLGQLIARVLTLYSSRVTVAGKHADKLELLSGENILTIMASDLNGKTFDLVVDATGNVSGFNTAAAATRPRGTFVLKSTVAESGSINLVPLVINEIKVIGSRCGPFPPALQALRTGRVRVEDLISRIVPFSNGIEAFEMAKQKQIMKIIVEF